MSKLLKVLISIDQFFAVLLLNADPEQTISGHVGCKAMTTNKRRYKLSERAINWLFSPCEQNHCRNSIEWDRIK